MFIMNGTILSRNRLLYLVYNYYIHFYYLYIILETHEHAVSCN